MQNITPDLLDRVFPHLWFYLVRFLITLAVTLPIGVFLSWGLRKLMGASVLVMKIVLTAVFIMTPLLLSQLAPSPSPVLFNFIAYGAAVGLSLGLFGEGLMGE